MLWGLVADDLTGAADSTVQFVDRGWSAELMIGSPDRMAELDRTGNQVIALSSGARALSEAGAARATADAIAELTAYGIDRLFIKIDSTMRGPVLAQVEGALTAWQRSQHGAALGVLCPAYPELGRTVVSGQVLVDGQPVTETDSGQDILTPVASSRLEELLPGSRWSAIAGVGAERLADQWTRQAAESPGSLITIDAADPDDLDHLGEAIARAGCAVVPIGSAGLARAVAHHASTAMPAPIRIVLAISSRHDVSRSQLLRLFETELPEVDLQVIQTPREQHNDAQDVARQLARQVRAALRAGQDGALVIVGGDGVLAVLGELGAESVTVVGRLVEGVPRGMIRGGIADGMTVVTKSGGFGGPDTLVEVATALATMERARVHERRQ